jgi:hypothetical protein
MQAILRRSRYVMQIALLCVGVLAWTALADAPAAVSLTPATQQIMRGDAFTLQVQIDNVADMLGANVVVAFDASRLQFQSILPGDLFPAGVSSSVYTLDNDTGVVSYAVTLLGPVAPVSGAGVLCELQGYALAPGDVRVSITQADLANSAIQLMPATTSDAVLRVGVGRAYLPAVAGIASP